MADTVRRIDYRYATISDKPGEGFKLTAALREAGVNLLAFSAFPAAKGKTQVDLATESDERLTRAAREAKIDLSDRKRAFLIQGDDRPGAMSDILQKLGAAKINITATDAVCAGAGRFGCILWVKPEMYEAAARALGA
jgi:hypothetical protein